MEQKLFEQIAAEMKPFFGKGKVAEYIPELRNVDPDQFGVSLVNVDGSETNFGDYQTSFSIQSISKIFSLIMVFSQIGDDLWKRVGKEPSGNPFNSLIQLEHEKGFPRNPFINAGALVVSDLLLSQNAKPKRELLSFIRELTENDDIYFNYKVAASERETGFRNAALANLMKSFGNIENEIDHLLDVYYSQCSIEMSCHDLAKATICLANGGKSLPNQKQILSLSQAKRINAILMLCGLYDESGDFAYRVGLPGKSGVGGGIVAICPGKFTISVWHPELTKYGNSLVGMKFLEQFTAYTDLSIF
ncbi:MAG: glutaminase [Candidatus Cloacimonadales bacterium]